MDKLYDAAKYYRDNLEGRRFLLVAAKKDKIVSLEIVFNEDAFKHLAGLQKADDRKIYSLGSRILYQQILDKKTTIEDIKDSSNFEVIENRLDNFQKIGDLLSSPEDMRKSLYGQFGKGRGIIADYLLSQKDEKKYIHLFLKENGDVVLPVTFFTNESDYYIKNNTTRWGIVDIEEILEKDEKTRKAKIAELRASLMLKTGQTMDALKKEVDKFHGRGKDNTSLPNENN